jgi:hypothetical protein
LAAALKADETAAFHCRRRGIRRKLPLGRHSRRDAVVEVTLAAGHPIESYLLREEIMRSAIVPAGLPFALTIIAFAAAAQAQQAMSDDQIIQKLNSAAPPTVVQGATIAAMEPGGKMRTIRQGKNGFTCMITPGAPMCADKNAMVWAQARATHAAAPPNKTGFIYMLDGDNGASNTDPWATGSKPDNHWVKTGPHVMVVGPVVKSMEGYPRSADADPTQAYVMWPNSPYQHLMIPAK